MAYIIIEDDRSVADALEALLQGAGGETRLFATAEGFIESGPPKPGDTVVVDLGLPGISGSMLLRWLLAMAEPPRIIVISGKSSAVIEREIGAVESYRVLRKPPAADWLEAIAG